MTCYVCKYDWCWTCGLHRRHFFHKMQLFTGETGILCEFINKVAHRSGNRNEMTIKSLPVRYFLICILFIIGPPLFLSGGIIAGSLAYPILPIWFMCNDGKKCCKCTRKIKPLYISLCVLMGLFMYIVFAIIGALGLIIACLAFTLFYILIIILALRMFFVQCCKSKKTST